MEEGTDVGGPFSKNSTSAYILTGSRSRSLK